MRVGIDARKLRDGGIGTYIRHLTLALAARPDAPELTAFLDPSDLRRVAWPSGRVHEIPVRAAPYGPWEHVAVPKAARRAGIDLFHEPHYTLPLGWHGPSVVTIHDLIHLRFPSFFRPGSALYARAMASAAVRRARLVLTDSRATREDVLGLLDAREERVRVVPLGVSDLVRRVADDEVSSFRAERSLPLDYLLYVGARKRHKNLSLLLESLARFSPGERPSLVLSGERWPPNDPHARLARRLGLDREVHFAGALENEHELSCVYSGAALYVQPSLVEGFGLPPLEAMACEVPVLASEEAALSETLGDAATLLPPRDPDAWQEAIRELLRDSETRAERVQRGVRRARSFTWEKTAEATFAAYRDAMSEAGRP